MRITTVKHNGGEPRDIHACFGTNGIRCRVRAGGSPSGHHDRGAFGKIMANDITTEIAGRTCHDRDFTEKATVGRYFGCDNCLGHVRIPIFAWRRSNFERAYAWGGRTSS